MMNSLASLLLGTICAGTGRSPRLARAGNASRAFPFDHLDKKLRRVAGQFLAGVIADDRSLGATDLALAVLRVAGQHHFAPFQVGRQRFPPGCCGRGF